MSEESQPAFTLRSVSRAPIRTRESAVTQSAWRMEIDSASGAGTITQIESPPPAAIYRGDGVALGWSQDELAAVYQELLPREAERSIDFQQLG